MWANGSGNCTCFNNNPARGSPNNNTVNANSQNSGRRRLPNMIKPLNNAIKNDASNMGSLNNSI